MKRLLITLVSAQTIPNLLFLKEFMKDGDDFLFITSPEMESKLMTEHIKQSVGIGKSEKLLIDVGSVDDIVSKLESFNWDEYDKVLLNTTGSTKLVSQIVFAFVKGRVALEAYYVPLNKKSLQQIHPEIRDVEFLRKPDINLSEYFRSFGYKIYQNSPRRSIVSDLFMKKVLSNRGLKNLSELSNRQSKDYQYYNGQWFEEWVYFQVKFKLGLRDDHIGLGVQFVNITGKKRDNKDQEIDVAFIYNNRLHLIECKAFTKPLSGAKFYNPMYKLSSISNMFGLNAQNYVCYIPNLKSPSTQKKNIAIKKDLHNIREIFTMNDYFSGSFGDYLIGLKEG